MSHYPEYKLPRARMSSTLITDYRHDDAVELYKRIVRRADVIEKLRR
jgi:hypothetical protein